MASSRPAAAWPRVQTSFQGAAVALEVVAELPDASPPRIHEAMLVHGELQQTWLKGAH